jgi:hypothetical protein
MPLLLACRLNLSCDLKLGVNLFIVRCACGLLQALGGHRPHFNKQVKTVKEWA